MSNNRAEVVDGGNSFVSVLDYSHILLIGINAQCYERVFFGQLFKYIIAHRVIYGLVNTTMYSTTVYLYQQVTKVLLVDTTGGYFTMRYNPVYAKTLTVNKGVDNVLLFEFINQDQKPVNITGSTFRFRLLNQTGDQLLVEKDMEILSATTGRVKVVLAPEDTNAIVAQPGSYSIERIQGNYHQAVFTNADSQARADCNIVDSVYPEFVPSQPVTVPTITGKNQTVSAAPTGWPDWALYPQPLNSTQQTEFYSSYIPTNGSSLTTVKMDLVHYTGTVKLQGAQTYQSEWYNVTESRQYLDATETVYFNAVGYHPLLRIALNTSIGYGATATANVINGVVNSINLTNFGNFYVAPPYVQILGYGSGAEAVATISPNGTVATITVTNGGSGYLPLQFQSETAATVVISNGVVENIQYR